MSFWEAYKELDQLCRDILSAEKGVSAYIEEMERVSYFRHQIPNWDQDYKALKHYRWVRNQIAHESGVTEEALCKVEDTLWIRQFRERILNQTDPLALPRKLIAEQAATMQNPVSPSSPTPMSNWGWYQPPKKKSVAPYVILGLLLAFLVIGSVACIVLLNV